MLTLDEGQVRRHLSYEKLIPALEKALIRYSRGALIQPVRTAIVLPDQHGIFGLMPAVDGDLMGIKLVTVYERNTGLPTHQATIQLFRASTGEPLAVMDGRLITEMRTAAISAIAARLFARSDARVLAILGSGVQAGAHLEALRMVRTFSEVRVWSRTPEHADRFAREHGVRASSLEEATRAADVVVGASSVASPLIRGRFLGATAFVAAVGAVGSAKRELDDATMDAHIVVESREAALKESGDILAVKAPIYAELGEVLSGDVPPPAGGRVIYKSLGIAAEDLAAARLVYEAVV